MDKEEQYDAKLREASLGGLLAGFFILLLVAILVMAVFMLLHAIQPSSPPCLREPIASSVLSWLSYPGCASAFRGFFLPQESHDHPLAFCVTSLAGEAAGLVLHACVCVCVTAGPLIDVG